VCGRYASSRGADYLAGHFEVDEPAEETVPPSWNVAPTDPVYAVLQRSAGRLLKVCRWGLVPSWADDPKVGSRFINARQETVAEKPAFRAAYQRRRCLVPADGWFEWKAVGKDKQPWFLTSPDREPLAFAGLYEVWRRELWTVTVITTSAPDELGEIHDRSPLLVPREHWSRWLDPAVEDPGDLLVPGVSGAVDAWPVSRAVGNVRNDGPELVEPVPVDAGPGDTLL
jgi:putative SOS response-associated peptidase YedK